MDDTNREVVTAEDCAKSWRELTPEKQAWISACPKYCFNSRASDGSLHEPPDPAEVWDRLTPAQRCADIDATSPPIADVLIDRVLMWTVSSAIAGSRAWAMEARSVLGPASAAADMRAYAAKVVAFLENQVQLYQQSEPSEAAAIRVAVLNIRKRLPPKVSIPDLHVEKQLSDGSADDENARAPAPGSTSPRSYLSTRQLAECFCSHTGLKDTHDRLSNYPDWATKDKALVVPGKRGEKHGGQWDPVQFALNLLERKTMIGIPGARLKIKHLDPVFGFKELLPWKDEWNRRKRSL